MSFIDDIDSPLSPRLHVITGRRPLNLNQEMGCHRSVSESLDANSALESDIQVMIRHGDFSYQAMLQQPLELLVADLGDAAVEHIQPGHNDYQRPGKKAGQQLDIDRPLSRVRLHFDRPRGPAEPTGPATPP